MEDGIEIGCSICGEEKAGEKTWFLVAENRWEDKLTVLEWNEQWARCEGFRPACCADHVEELVVHWMTTGSLGYPFARVSLGGKGRRWNRAIHGEANLQKGSAPKQIGELLIHRESVERVLNERPESLRGILEALVGALQKESRPGKILPQSKAARKQVSVPQAS